MAIMNPKTALEHEKITSFGGICDHAGLTSEGASDMRNFRILSDGSLEKRCGFFTRYLFGASIRGLWEGTVSGETYLFVVAGNQIYRKSRTDGYPTSVYTLPTAEGNVNFAFYRENLYLFDGKTVLIFSPSIQSFSVAEGYTPLYGKNWHPTQLGEIHEPLNLLQNSIRIHYLNTNGSTVFNLPFTSQKITSMKAGGSYTNLYSFTPGTSSFSIPTSLAGVGSVEVTVTLDALFSERSYVVQASNPSVFRTPHHESLLTFGGGGGYTVYRTAPVSDEMLDECRITCAGADPLYFPKGNPFAVGSSLHPIRALCQLDDQMLVFNDENIWAIRYLNDLEDDAEILLLRSALGCASENGVLIFGEHPIAVSDGGVVQLTIRPSDPNFCDTSILSRKIERRLSKEFLNSAILFWHRSKHQLWVRSTSDSDGLVWIFDPERDLWFCFDGIRANRFFEMEGKLGFATDDGEICFFEEDLDSDDGKAFTAYYQSHHLAFSNPEFSKRSVRFSLCSVNNGGALSTEIETERGKKQFEIRSERGGIPLFFDRRLAMGRFRFLRFRLSSANVARCKIYSVSIAANN